MRRNGFGEALRLGRTPGLVLLAVALGTSLLAALFGNALYATVEQRPRRAAVASPAAPVVWVGKAGGPVRGASATPAARDFYVSPTGRPNGTGKKRKPWDLRTALSHPAKVRPGDTIWLRGGTYRGSFTSELTGTASAPITLRSFPGEHVVIDGNWATTLSAPMSEADKSFTVEDASNIRTGNSVLIDQEEIRITGEVRGNTVRKCARGVRGSVASAHQAGAVAKLSDTTLTVNGAHTWFWGFEVLNSDPVRVSPNQGSNPAGRRGTGVLVYGPGSKLINLVIHDTGQGVGLFSQATDAEVYGCIIYNNGWDAPDRGHGHGIYSQNETGTKRVRDNVVFGNMGGYAIHCYGSDNSSLTGFEFEGNSVFENGWLVGGGAPAGRISVVGNYLYGTGLRLGYSNRYNEDATVRGNYVYADLPFSARWWKHLAVTENRFFGRPSGQGGSASIYLRQDGRVDDHTFDYNTYVNGRSGRDRTFSVYSGAGEKTTYFFDEWQQLGYDAHGTFASGEGSKSGARPQGVHVFVRQNQYDSRRLTVTVFNWDGLERVGVDLAQAGFQAGDAIEIRNALDYFGEETIARAYDGGAVNLPLSGRRVARPLGLGDEYGPRSTPEFSVFVVSRVE